MASRRTEGRPRGSIRQHGRLFQVRVYAGVDPATSRRIELYGTRHDEKEAQKLLNEFLVKVDAGRVAKARVRLEKALDAWLETADIEASTRHGYEGYIRRNLKPALGSLELSKINVRVLERFYAGLRRCRDLCNGKPQAAHKCKPLAASTVKQLHAILSGTFDAAVRWEWMTSNPARLAKKPRQLAPDPRPPTSEQAAKLVNAAFAQDEDWGTLVWLVMVTGVRRGEVCALRREDVDFSTKILTVRRNYVVRGGRRIEKDTKTHQRRHISLDAETVRLLKAHWRRACAQALKLDVRLGDDAYLFSYAPDHSEPCNPDGVSHRYVKMAADLGIDSHIHALRHFSATELISSGVDVRTVAGRLGHGGGGTTTLRVYSAWVPESDRRAAATLAKRLQSPQQPRRSPKGNMTAVPRRRAGSDG